MTRIKSISLLTGAAVLVLAALALAGCGSSGDSSAPPTAPNGAPATIGVENSDLGDILVNSQGHTLYLFQRDTGAASACTGPCAADWPPLRVSGRPTVGNGADEAKAATASRSDGNPQVTYNGHRLYLYVHDHKAGDTNGEGLNAFGGLWYALSSAGNQVTGPANGNSGPGYGY
jgi:predicted lipoprotein with Yx(FWY)xxD motif